jgi:hypothetical protein
MSKLPQSLIDEISNGRASLFLGAGASIEAKFPSSQELVKLLIDKSRESDLGQFHSAPLDTIAQHLYLKAGEIKRGAS